MCIKDNKIKQALIFIFFCFTYGVLWGYADQNINNNKQSDSNRVEKFKQLIHEVKEPKPSDKSSQKLLPERPSFGLENKENMNAYNHSLRGYYRYLSNGYEHRKRVFEWQLFSSKILFWVVIGLVVIGIYFAWLQFQLDQQKYPIYNTERSISTTEFEASVKGFRIKSSTLGVIILALSLLFFYLYLVFVYPIVNTF